jgi:hypothetical protein
MPVGAPPDSVGNAARRVPVSGPTIASGPEASLLPVMVITGLSGFGDPLERDPDSVKENVIHGYVSLERALKDYGVALREVDARPGCAGHRRVPKPSRADVGHS